MERNSKQLAREVLRIFPNEGRLIKTSLRKLRVQKELAVSNLMHYVTGLIFLILNLIRP